MSRFVLSASFSAVALAGPHALARGDSPDDLRAVVAEMLADVQQRSSLLAGGTSGHDGSFFIASDDTSFRLNVGGMIQARYVADFRDDSDPDDFESGFQVWRTELRFSGNVHANWLYFIEGEFDRDGGAFNLNDAYIGYKLNDRWTLVGGQVKAPALREESLHERFQLAVDRSITNSVFSQGRSHAVAAIYTDDTFQFIPVFSDGARSEDTDFTNPAEADWSFTGRLNWKLAGAWSAFDDFTSWRGSPFAAMLGAAVHYQQSDNSGNPMDTDVNVLLYNVDAQLEGDGWNFFATFIGRRIDVNTLAGDSDFDDFGIVAQGGVFISDKDELFARYDIVIPDSDRMNTGGTGDADPFSTLTVGINHYFAGHAAKLTFDGQYCFDAISDTALVAPDSGIGFLGSSEDGEVILRLQFQLLF